MACGAAIANLRVAAQHHGDATSVELQSAHRRDGLVARVRLEERCATSEDAEELFQAIPRPGHPADIASAALFLASDESAFVNGHAMVVDGGLTAGRRFSEAQESWNTFRDLMEIPRKETPRPS